MRSRPAVRRSRAGLQDPNRPMGSFMFLGPHRRRQDRADQGRWRNICFNDEDRHGCGSTCPEYMEKGTRLSRLIGARPPGYCRL